MTNNERQKSLDKKKWLDSEKEGRDLSGAYFYCDSCRKQTNDGCRATQEERESECLCAKAFNRFQRGKL